MTDDEKITFEERKSIVMIDGQMPESYANIIAWKEIEEKREKMQKNIKKDVDIYKKVQYKDISLTDKRSKNNEYKKSRKNK